MYMQEFTLHQLESTYRYDLKGYYSSSRNFSDVFGAILIHDVAFQMYVHCDVIIRCSTLVAMHFNKHD